MLTGHPQAPNAKARALLINNELSRLDTLIQATEKSLDAQKQLRGYLVEYYPKGPRAIPEKS